MTKDEAAEVLSEYFTNNGLEAEIIDEVVRVSEGGKHLVDVLIGDDYPLTTPDDIKNDLDTFTPTFADQVRLTKPAKRGKRVRLTATGPEYVTAHKL